MHRKWGLKQVSVKGIANRFEASDISNCNRHFMETVFSHTVPNINRKVYKVNALLSK